MELPVVAEIQVKATPSALYNNLSCSGNILAFGHQQDVVVVRPLGAQKLPISESEKAPTRFVSIHQARNRQVILFGSARLVGMWDPATDTLLCRFPSTGADGAEPRAAALVALAGDRLIVSVGYSDFTTYMYELHADFTPQLHAQHRQHAAPITCLAGSCESPQVLFASGDNSGALQLWNLALAPFVTVPPVHATECCTCVEIITTTFVAAAYGSGKIRLFSQAGEPRVEICAHSRWINALSFHRGRMLLSSAGDDCCVCVWQVPSAENGGRARLVGFRQTKNALYTGVAFSGDGSNVIAAAFDSEKIGTFGIPAS